MQKNILWNKYISKMFNLTEYFLKEKAQRKILWTKILLVKVLIWITITQGLDLNVSGVEIKELWTKISVKFLI